MSTISKTGFTGTGDVKAERVKLLSPAFWEAAEFGRFGITPLILLVVVCVGGFAAAAATAVDSVAQLFTVSIACTLTLMTIIAVMPMKLVVFASVVSMVIDIVILLLYIL